MLKYLSLLATASLILPRAIVAEPAPVPSSFDFHYVGASVASLQTVTPQFASSKAGTVTPVTEEGEDRLRLTGSPGSFSFSCPVEKNTEYLLRVKVQSNDQVVFQVGQLSMSYNDLGHWQTVTGLCPSGDAGMMEVKATLHSLTAEQSASAEIKDISLIRVERPTVASRRSFSGQTSLVQDGAAAATIIIPAGNEMYLKLAGQISAAVKARTGVDLPIVSDTDATEKDYPILKEPFQKRNLILLGRLGNNRAFWTAYNRFLTAVDGFYPGGNGYAVHTASNVFHTGINHLIIGGTTDEGVRRGTAKFVEKIEAAPADSKGLRLPWLLETDLQGDCLAFFKQDDAKWKEKPENGWLPKPEPAYGNVSRWYDNAMGYYWTGWDSYHQREKQYLAQIIDEHGVTHQYITEFLVRAYNMLDVSGVIPPEQVQKIDSLLTQNFFDYLAFSELSWMTTFAPPYGQIGLENRHQIAPWMGDYKMAEFITDILTPVGGLKDLAEFRREEKERALIDFVKHRSAASLPGATGPDADEEINASLFRFALEKDLYREFFGSGNADRSLELERIDPITGIFAYPSGPRDSKLLLGIMACLTGKPEYQWLWHHLPEVAHPQGYFQFRYLGQTRRYTPDADAPEAIPQSWSGIHFATNPVDNDPGMKADSNNYYFISEGTGLRPDDDYIAFNGVSYLAPSGVVAKLNSQGCVWLGEGIAGGRFDLNSASAIRTDRMENNGKFDDFSRCLWSAELPTGNAMRFRQLLSNDIRWTRDVIHLGRGVYAFRDCFTALADGTYSLNVNWHPTGTFSREGTRLTFLAREGKMEIECFGDDFSENESSRQDNPARVSVRNQALKKLAKGQSVVSYSVLQITADQATPPAMTTLSGDNRLSVGSAVLDWKPTASGSFATDADLVIQTPAASGFYHAGRVTLGEQAVTDFNPTQSFGVSATGEWNHLPEGKTLSTEEGHNVFQAATAWAGKATVPPTTTSLTPSDDGLQIKLQDLSKNWKQAWHDDSFLRPAKVTDVKIDNGVIDFGKVLNLTEIRMKSDQLRFFAPTHIPTNLELATDLKGPWKLAEGKRAWRPSIRSGNYGESHPVKEADETLLLSSVPARYVKPASPLLGFFTDSWKEARHPLRVETGDFLNNGSVQTLIVSDVFPQFPRSIRDDDVSAALLSDKGSEIFHLNFAGPVQSVRLLDWHGNGTKDLFVLYANGTLEIYNLAGKLERSADLYQMHEEFQKNYGRKSTRQPAGGFVLPFSVGLWRPDASGKSEIVVGRYGGFSFLNPDLTWKGLLSVSGYATPGILANGADFDGSGVPEQVVAERMRIWQIGGSGKPTVREPNGAEFWPQVYQLDKVIPEYDASTAPLGGYPTVRFELLQGLTPKPRYVLLARGTSVCIYDAKEKTIFYNWNGQARITGLGIVSEQEGKLELVVSTQDRLLWHFDWTNGLDHDPVVTAKSFPDLITNIQETGSGPRSLVLSGTNGLYLRSTDGDYAQIAKGSFKSAAPQAVQDGQVGKVVAADAQGQVLSFERKP